MNLPALKLPRASGLLVLLFAEGMCFTFYDGGRFYNPFV
jgi:hypothetical protein